MEDLQSFHSRRNGQRITRKRPGLIDGTQRGQLLHDLCRPSKGAYRQPAADNLSQRGQVRLNAVKFLRASVCHPEAGNHLVENEESSLLPGQLAKPGQIARLGRHASHISGNRLDQYAGQFIPVLLKGFLQSRNIVERNRQSQLSQGGRHAGAVGQAQRGHSGAGLGQQRVAVAVVATFEFDDFVAPCDRPRQANRGKRRLGSRACQPNSLNRRKCLMNPGGKLHFPFG